METNVPWLHHNPVRITCGAGVFDSLGSTLPPNGRLLLVTTAGFTRRGVTGRLLDQLGADRVTVLDSITPNPELDALDLATENLRSADISGILGVGGGSVLDAAKVLGVTLPSCLNRPLDHALRRGLSHSWDVRLPVTAVPTTSGTGAEVTPFATVWDHATQRKHSLSGDSIFPTQALLDPSLTTSLPEDETVYTALDTVSHALESLWNKNRTPVSALFAVQALKLSVYAIPKILHSPIDLEGRAAMQQASLLAGLAISQTRTAIAHALSYPLTLRWDVPHGLACSFTLERIIYHYLNGQPDSPYKSIMLEARALIQGLGLRRRLGSYLTDEQLRLLFNDAPLAERAGNYELQIDSLVELIPA